MSRLTQILRGKKLKPLTEMESAVKYAMDNAGGGVMVVTEGDDSQTLDKTWNEIFNALTAGKIVTIVLHYGDVTHQHLVTSAFDADGDFTVLAVSTSSGDKTTVTFVVDSADGYPVRSKNG